MDKIKKDRTFCCVPQCHSQGTKNPELSFHQFPRDTYKIPVKCLNGTKVLVPRKTEWIRLLRIGKELSNRAKVCSKHFVPEDYITPANRSQRPHLRPFAVPSRFLPVTSKNDKKTTARRQALDEKLKRSKVGAQHKSRKGGGVTRTNSGEETCGECKEVFSSHSDLEVHFSLSHLQVDLGEEEEALRRRPLRLQSIIKNLQRENKQLKVLSEEQASKIQSLEESLQEFEAKLQEEETMRRKLHKEVQKLKVQSKVPALDPPAHRLLEGETLRLRQEVCGPLHPQEARSGPHGRPAVGRRHLRLEDLRYAPPVEPPVEIPVEPSQVATCDRPKVIYIRLLSSQNSKTGFGSEPEK